MGSCVEGAIPLAVEGLNRRTNSFVMCGSSALGHGGTSATAMRCWHFAAPSITGPSIGYLNAIDSDFERRKNHRMLLTLEACISADGTSVWGACTNPTLASTAPLCRWHIMHLPRRAAKGHH